MLRTRSTGQMLSRDPITYQTRLDNCSNTDWRITGGTVSLASGETRTMTDVVTKRFRELQAKGQTVFNPMSYAHEVATVSGSGSVRRDRTGFDCSGTTRYTEVREIGPVVSSWYLSAIGKFGVANQLPVLSDLLGSDIQSYLGLVSTKVRSERGRSSTNAWENLAELDSTLGTIARIARGGYQTLVKKKLPPLSTFKKKDKVSGLREDLSSSVLTWRYGIRPVLQDIGTLIEEYDRKYGQQRVTSRAVEHGFRTDSVKHSVTWGSGAVDIHVVYSDEVTVRAMSLDEMRFDFFQKYGLSLKGLLTLPWELTTLSFVADWLANIGDFVGAVVPTFGLSQIGSCYTIDRTRTAEFRNLVTKSVGVWDFTLDPTTQFKRVSRVKERVTGLPAPSIHVQSSFKFDNAVRCLDALSLFSQRAIRRA